jgi:hypothetical protein
MRQYARHLKERVDRGELAGSTANTYWNYIAAFLGWCVYEELVAEDPVRTRRAEEELPDKRPRSDRQQFWSREDRDALLAHLNERMRLSTSEGWMRSRNFAIGRSPRCSLIQVCVVGRSFAIRTTSVGVDFAGATSISTLARSSFSERTKPTRKRRFLFKHTIHSNGCTRRSDRRAASGQSFRRSTDRRFLELSVLGSLLLGTKPAKSKK